MPDRNRTIATWVLAILAVACVQVGRAHHSSSKFDVNRSIWVKGTVARYQPISPHALITLEETGKDGMIKRWTVEGPSLFRLTRMGVGDDFLKPGDVIEVCGFAFRAPAAEGSARPSLHGHMLVMPDGKKRLFGPYGKLDKCIRPEDTAQSWADFLKADPLALQAWCANHTHGQEVDEIDGLLANSCG